MFKFVILAALIACVAAKPGVLTPFAAAAAYANAPLYAAGGSSQIDVRHNYDGTLSSYTTTPFQYSGPFASRYVAGAPAIARYAAPLAAGSLAAPLAAAPVPAPLAAAAPWAAPAPLATGPLAAPLAAAPWAASPFAAAPLAAAPLAAGPLAAAPWAGPAAYAAPAHLAAPAPYFL